MNGIPEIKRVSGEEGALPVIRRFSADQLTAALNHPLIEEVLREVPSSIHLGDDNTAAALEIRTLETGRKWFQLKLRDHELDGPNWKATSLSTWQCKSPVDIWAKKAVERSRYILDPRYPLENDLIDPELVQYVKNPWEHIPYEDPTPEKINSWLDKWKTVVQRNQPIYPGSFYTKHINEYGNFVHQFSVDMLRNLGYEQLTSNPTWYHIAKLNEKRGYSYKERADSEAMAKMDLALSGLSNLDMARRSWVCTAQYMYQLIEENGQSPEHITQLHGIDQSTVLRDTSGRIITYPLFPNKNLWQILPLNK